MEPFEERTTSAGPGVPAGVVSVTMSSLGRPALGGVESPIVVIDTFFACAPPIVTVAEEPTPVQIMRMESPPCGDPILSMIRTTCRESFAGGIGGAVEEVVSSAIHRTSLPPCGAPICGPTPYTMPEVSEASQNM